MRFHLRYVVVDTEYPGSFGAEIQCSEPLMHQEAVQRQTELNQEDVIEGTATEATEPIYGETAFYGPMGEEEE